MASRKCLLLISLSILVIILCLDVKADQTIILKIDSLDKRELKWEDFGLSKDTKIHIFAIGAALRSSQAMYAYGWILNRDNHQVVWEMKKDETSAYKKSKQLRESDQTIQLPPGSYRASYYVGSILSSGEYDFQIHNWDEFVNFIGDIIQGTKTELSKNSEKESRELRLVLTTQDSDYSPLRREQGKESDLIRLDKLGDFRQEKAGFALDRDMDLHIYAVGEYSYSGDRMADFGWIIDATTRKKAWEMDRTNTKRAGGAKKNRVFDEIIHLPSGQYILYFVTDDSHSYEEWNETPPFDPQGWGITITTKDQATANKYFHRKDEILQEKSFIQLVGVGDNEVRSAYFSLQEPMALHIYALGEKGPHSGQMVDYGWIENANTKEVVWEMNGDNTDYAGGGSKNRKFDDVVKLDKGDYAVYYITDDSHSFNDWNNSPPYDPKNWGITISGIGNNFDISKVRIYDKKKASPNTLVELIGLGDNKRVNQTFDLEKTAKLHIYALGEGDADEMYDYGWIKDLNSGKTIWEMSYRNTTWAGGAKKNRIYDDTIILEKGTYRCYFITDDSHSFNHWNAPQPKDPYHWGITITKSE